MFIFGYKFYFCLGGNVFGCFHFFLPVCVCTKNCLFPPKLMEQILMKFVMWVESDQRKKCLNFGKDHDHILH